MSEETRRPIGNTSGKKEVGVEHVPEEVILNKLVEGHMDDLYIGAQVFNPEVINEKMQTTVTEGSGSLAFNPKEGLAFESAVFINPIVHGMAIHIKGVKNLVNSKTATKRRASSAKTTQRKDSDNREKSLEDE